MPPGSSSYALFLRVTAEVIFHSVMFLPTLICFLAKTFTNGLLFTQAFEEWLFSA